MRYRFQYLDQVFELSLERQGDLYRAVIDGQAYEVEVLDAQPGQLDLRFAGRPLTLYWAADREGQWISREGCTYRLEKPAPRGARRGADAAALGQVRAPMPAQVQAVLVSAGESVTKGQTLMQLEAMKMEIRIQAPRSGMVARLPVSEGQAVERDQLLAEIREPEE